MIPSHLWFGWSCKLYTENWILRGCPHWVVIPPVGGQRSAFSFDVPGSHYMTRSAVIVFFSLPLLVPPSC